MKENPFMSKNELIKFLTLGTLCGELAGVIEHTDNKSWRQKLKTCVTYLDRVLIERLSLLDRKQLDSVNRRKNTTHIFLKTEDQLRYDKDEQEIVKVVEEDLFELAELALNSCLACKEGDIVKECRFRSVMHRVGIPVVNCKPKAGQCEYRLRQINKQ